MCCSLHNQLPDSRPIRKGHSKQSVFSRARPPLGNRQKPTCIPDMVSILSFVLVCPGSPACASAKIEAHWIRQRVAETCPTPRGANDLSFWRDFRCNRLRRVLSPGDDVRLRCPPCEARAPPWVAPGRGRLPHAQRPRLRSSGSSSRMPETFSFSQKCDVYVPQRTSCHRSAELSVLFCWV